MADSASVQRSWPRSWLKLALRWLIYISLSLLLLHEATGSDQTEECSGVDSSVAAMSRNDYRLLVRYAIPEKPGARKVVLVTIGSQEPAEVTRDPCQQRLFVARLIQRLKELNVSVVALDRLYDVNACTKDGPETKALLEAVKGPAPVVTLGAGTALVSKAERGADGDCLKAVSNFDLGLPKERLGLIRLDSDTRRIPLQWPLKGETAPADALALVTARAADPGAVQSDLLEVAKRRRENPFSTMVKINHHSAFEVLCGKRAHQSNWRQCTSDEFIEGMNGAIVVIGQHFGDSDLHPAIQGLGSEQAENGVDAAPDGQVYGADLQANYVAALLDKRYYLPLLPEWGNQVLIVAFFILLQVLFWRSKRLWMGAIYGIVLWAAIVLVSVEILALKRYLLTVWVQGINFFTILVSWLEHWAAKMNGHGQQ